MTQLVKVSKNGVSAYDLYEYLEVKTRFSQWFNRRITDYGFIQGKDFVPFLGESTGGRPREDFILSIGTAKELSIVEKTSKGQEIRRYLIEVENKYREQLIRNSRIETRKTFTEELKESEENERMHGHAYSTYTKLIYKKLGIEYVKQKNFRDTLSAEQQKAVETLEHLAQGYIKLGYEYSQIKQALPDVILNKQKELENER